MITGSEIKNVYRTIRESVDKLYDYCGEQSTCKSCCFYQYSKTCPFREDALKTIKHDFETIERNKGKENA